MLLKVIVLSVIQHVLIRGHFILPGVQSDLVKDRVNHLKHAFIPELILVSLLVMLFSEKVSLSLSDTGLLGLHSPEINPQFVDGFVVFLSFLV